MQLALASGVFVLVALFALAVASRWSDRFWHVAEYFVLALAFAGVTISIADIEVSRAARQEADERARVQTSKANLIYRTEWVMNVCDVWWDDVLNQTNEPQPNCLAPHPITSGMSCESSCRAGHLVGQHRMRTYTPDEEQTEAENLFFNICLGDDEIGMCDALDAYRDAAKRYATMLDQRTVYDHLTNLNVSLIAQVLLAIALGLQAGKIRRDFARPPQG